MVEYEDRCVGCKDLGLPCYGSSCPNKKVPVWYCDKCGDETQLYEFEGQELCIGCIEELLAKVN